MSNSSRRQLLKTLGGGALGVTMIGSATAESETDLSYGDAVSGTVDDQLRFSGSEDDIVSIDARVNDPVNNALSLELSQPNGDTLATESSNGEDGNAHISGYELPQIDGEYIIDLEPDSHSDSETFGYDLTLYEGIPADDEISYGESTHAEITRSDRFWYTSGGRFSPSGFRGYHHTYSFEGSEGDTVSIEARPEDPVEYNVQLEVYTPSDESSINSTWEGEDGNAVVTGIELEQDGEYIIVVTGQEDTDRFEYELFLEEGIPIDDEISFGESIEDEITRSDRYWDVDEGRYMSSSFRGYHRTYSLSATEDDVVGIDLRLENPHDYDAQLELYDPTEDRIYDSSFDGEGGNTSISRAELERDGEFIIVVTGLDDTDRFEYELFLYEGLPVDDEISYGETISDEITDADRYQVVEHDRAPNQFRGYHRTYSFDANSGDVVTIEALLDAPLDYDAQLELYDPSEEQVTVSMWDGDDGNALIEEWELDHDEYKIVVTGSETDDEFGFDLKLEREDTGAEPATVEIVDLSPGSTTAEPGDDITVEATIANAGEEADAVTVAFRFDSDDIDSDDIEIDGGEEQDVEFDLEAPDEEGDYSYEVAASDDSLSETVTIEEQTDGPSIEVSELTVEPSSLETGEQIQVLGTVENTGDEPDTAAITVLLDGDVIDEIDTELDVDEVTDVDVTTSAPTTSGEYTYEIHTQDDGEGVTASVVEPESDDDDSSADDNGEDEDSLADDSDDTDVDDSDDDSDQDDSSDDGESDIDDDDSDAVPADDTESTDDDDDDSDVVVDETPGLGIVGTIAGIGGVTYLLKRRLTRERDSSTSTGQGSN